MRRAIAIGLAALIATGATWPARAGEPRHDLPPAVRLERAQVCYRVDDLVCAREELDFARARRAELDRPGEVELERLTAAVALAAGDLAGAGRALDRVIALDPGWTPPDTASVTFREAWAAARRRADLAAPELTVPPLPERVRAGKAVPVEAAVSDPSGVDRVVLHVAMADGTVVDLAMSGVGDGRYRGAVPGELVTVPEVRLWLEAWDTLGNGPARWGDAAAPRRVAVSPVEDGGGITTKWWFWTAIGVGAVATGVVLAVALSGGGGDSAGYETGGLRLDPEFPR